MRLSSETKAKIIEGERSRRRDDGRPDSKDIQLHVPALDVHVVQAAFAWLRLSGARSAAEVDESRLRLGEILAFSLQRAPSGDERDDNFDDRAVPGDFNRWVFRVIAENLGSVEEQPEQQALRRTFFDLAVTSVSG